MHKAAIVYHYLALYRLPIFKELINSDKVEFTLYSGNESEIPIKKIDKQFANLSPSDGGLRWKFLKNRWLLRGKFLWQSGLIKMVMKAPYDSFIFLGSPYHLSTWFAVIIARIRRKKVYYWMHGLYRDRPVFVDWIKLRLFYKLATGFFLYGNRALSILKQYNVKPVDKMYVIYNSLDYDESLKRREIVTVDAIKKYRKDHFGDPETPIVVFIGRLNKIKRIDLLIAVQNVLKQKNGSVFFNILLIGDGSERVTLEKQAKSFGLQENIQFFGAAYDEETNSKALLHADLCVTPGEVGLTAIHSLSYGTPVISHNNLNIQMPEIEAIVPKATGDLYNYNSSEHLAAVIEEWLTKYPIKSAEIANNCFKKIDNYYNPHYQRSVIENVLLKDC